MAASVAQPGVASAGARNPWIVSPLTDSLIVIGAPLLILPLLFGLSRLIEPVALAGFVLGAVSTGHHLPGFVRAYSDPVLFARYRFRLTVIPPLLFAVIFWFTWNDLHGAILVVGTWGIWHGFMQMYGFARIYDVKGGEPSKLGARMDWLLCAVGFIAILIWSQSASLRIADAAEGSGLFFVPLLFGETAKNTAAVVGLAMVALYAVFTVVELRRGRRIAPLKLLLLGTSLVFLYWSWVLAGSAVLLGLAAWEAYHDVQYLAIAWSSNRRLAEKPDAGPLLRRLYGPGLGLVALYVGLCLAYGLAANAQGISASRWVGALLFSIVLTSALLHFYYDGFIWKVRQAKTLDDLGISSSGASQRVSGATRTRDWVHAALFAAPFALFAYSGTHRADFEIPMREAIAQIAPGDASQQLKLAFAYQRAGAFDDADAAYMAALAAGETSGLAHHNLGTSLARRGQAERAIDSHRAALIADPTLAPSSIALANLLIADQRGPEAVEVLRAAGRHDGDSPGIQSALARALLASSPDAAQVAEAVAQSSRAVTTTGFNETPPLLTLARALAAQQRFNRAIHVLERAQQIEAGRNPALSQQIERELRAYRAVLRPPRKRG
jgi:tetratricopeptide (TPR) repeat protein